MSKVTLYCSQCEKTLNIMFGAYESLDDIFHTPHKYICGREWKIVCEISNINLVRAEKDGICQNKIVCCENCEKKMRQEALSKCCWYDKDNLRCSGKLILCDKCQEIVCEAHSKHISGYVTKDLCEHCYDKEDEKKKKIISILETNPSLIEKIFDYLKSEVDDADE